MLLCTIGVVEFVPLLSHIARGVRSVLACHWGSTPITSNSRTDPAFCEITPYFGVMEGPCTAYSADPKSKPKAGMLGDYRNHQIFPRAALAPLLDGLWREVMLGRPALWVAELTTVANRHLGIHAGQVHRVAFLFLSKGTVAGSSGGGGPQKSSGTGTTNAGGDFAQSPFLEALAPATRRAVKQGKFGAMRNFPHYKTAGQNGQKDIDFSRQQVLLLAEHVAQQLVDAEEESGLMSSLFGKEAENNDKRNKNKIKIGNVGSSFKSRTAADLFAAESETGTGTETIESSSHAAAAIAFVSTAACLFALAAVALTVWRLQRCKAIPMSVKRTDNSKKDIGKFGSSGISSDIGLVPTVKCL
jgi:hypothetical protein